MNCVCVHAHMPAGVYACAHCVLRNLCTSSVFFFLNKSHILRSDYIHVKTTTDVLYNLLEMTCLYIGLCKVLNICMQGIANFQQFDL